MKLSNIAALALVLGVVTACGSESYNGNVADLAQPEVLEGADAEAELASLGFNGDACSISLSQATYTLAQGGNVSVKYSFFKGSKGDRVRITRISDSAVLWDSGVLPQAAGTLAIPVSSLGKGQMRIQGFINTYKSTSDQLADCGPGKKVVIRVN